jgi:similar to stage IV sporulation protein
MVRFKYFLFGYREIFVGESVQRFVSGMIRAKIPFEVVRFEKIIVSESYFERFSNLFEKDSYTASEPKGIMMLHRRVKHKGAILVSVLLGVILTVLSGFVVWDVRISGNEEIPDALIMERLSESGFSVGSFWSGASLSDVEYDMLDKCDDIAWININRIGTVAFVKVIERADKPSLEEMTVGYGNIVADRDCVIEEITVSVGTPAVKIGDTVKKGDVLIMGVENNELGRLVRADGTVVGRAYDTVSTVVGRERSTREKKNESVRSINIKIFGFSLNIFKKYGNLDSECDIIESKRRVTLFGRYKLPIEIETERYVIYDTVYGRYNDGELISVCSVRHRQMLKSLLFDKELSKISTSGFISDEEYTITSEIAYSARVGVFSPIRVE